MANRPKAPMPISERAKQFLPFAAVKGLTEALEKKEKIFVTKVEMSEALAMELNEKIHNIQKGSIVTITYFNDDAFIRFTGTVVEIDSIFRTIQIDDTRIDIDDIQDLELK